MRRFIGTGLLALLAAGFTPARSETADFDYLVGTWTTVKDGLSLTTEIVPILGGTALQETSISDDGNHLVATTITSRNADGVWTRTWFNNAGMRSTFVGGPTDDGNMALEQNAFNGRAIDPPQSRLLFVEKDADTFVLDWQSRNDEGGWNPRFLPFVHERVDRPAPPTGEGRIAFISKRSGNWDIFTMNPDGSDVRNVTDHPGGDHFPRWIAGGTRLAFRSQRSRDDGAWDRWEVDIDGTDAAHVPMLERLNNPDVGEFPEMHPSGSYLVNAVERDGEQDLYVWRFDGGGERVLAPAAGLDYRPLFSPDGERVLFISERDGNAEIYTVAFDGSNLRRLTDAPGIDRYARWSPDGTRIGFVSDRDGNLEVYVMNADGSNQRRLTTNDAEDGEISWSPDGRKIAYRSDASGNGEIHVLDVESGTSVNISRNDAYDGEPVWSPVR